MDLNSLLNAGGNAAEQQKKGDVSSKTTPTRNRTPWDAGGYSLPINTIAPSTRPSAPAQMTQQPTQEIEAPTGAPSSPRHKFSDSRSSLSSFTSSLQSTSHSRYSSLSTVASQQQINSIGETLSPIAGSKKHSVDFGAAATEMEGIQPSTNGTQHRGSVSPTGSMEALVLAAEKHSVGQRSSLKRNRSLEDTTMSQATEKPSSPSQLEILPPGERPSSPSDAILIKRSTLPSLRVDTGNHDQKAASEEAEQSRSYLSAPLDPLLRHTHLVSGRGHHRSVSAPDFKVFSNNLVMSTSMSMGPRPDPTPPHSNHPDGNSPTTPISAYPAPDTPPSTVAPDSNNVQCMYIQNCDTGSQPRKAISHIFGRNKMCTRQIPRSIWVHYCRKHYQRSRYRNPKEYAKLQCDLVQQQIRRIHLWSEDNREQELAGVVTGWDLAIRKREQKRIDEARGQKRTLSALEDDDHAPIGAQLPTTAVPTWLLGRCGKDYSTYDILEIFNELHQSILDDKMQCFPDIEILPNISVDQDEQEAAKTFPAKRSAANGHKRAQSLNVGLVKQETQSPDRRMSQPTVWNQQAPAYAASLYMPPVQAQKRRRANEMNENMSPSAFSSRNHFQERTIEAGRRMQQFQNGPMYEIPEDLASSPCYYAAPEYTQHAPMPAPTPQRMGGSSVASQLETNQFASRRPFHQRSQSDISGFGQVRGRNDYSPAPPSSAYGQEASTYQRPSPFHDSGTQYPSPQQQRGWDPAVQMIQQYPMQKQQPSHQQPPFRQHHRNQSTPMMQSYQQGPLMQASNCDPPPPQNAMPLQNPQHHIIESQQARELYGTRR